MPHRPAPATGLVVAALLLVGCSGGVTPDPAPPAASRAPAPSPAPSPTPAAPPAVTGAVTLTAVHLEPAGQRLFPPGHPGDQPVAVDEDAVHAFVGGIAGWLDAHLEALQRGAPVDLPAELGTDAAAEARAAVTTALAGPERHVAGATYVVEVAVDGGPRWAHVTVQVLHPDGTSAAADLLFLPTDGAPELVAAGPAAEVA